MSGIRRGLGARCPRFSALALALAGTLLLSPPARAATGSEITLAAALNAVLAGGAAVLTAPPGGRFRAFRYGLAGGAIAATPLWAADAYRRRGGPYLLRALNAYGANVVGRASAPANPLIAALRDFAYPIGPGVLALRDGRPRGYVLDAARLAALGGGFIVGRFDGRETRRLGVPVFRYGRGSVRELVGTGEADHNSYGGLFNTIFIYELSGVSQDALMAHEFYHTLQDDRALLYMSGDSRLKLELLRLGDVLALRLDGSYVATDAAALAVSQMWTDHDRRPLEREADLFRERTGLRNALTGDVPGLAWGP